MLRNNDARQPAESICTCFKLLAFHLQMQIAMLSTSILLICKVLFFFTAFLRSLHHDAFLITFKITAGYLSIRSSTHKGTNIAVNIFEPSLPDNEKTEGDIRY
jgi:hypothetical protein